MSKGNNKNVFLMRSYKATVYSLLRGSKNSYRRLLHF